MAARWPSKEAAAEELAQSDLTYPSPGQPDLIEVTQAWLDERFGAVAKEGSTR